MLTMDKFGRKPILVLCQLVSGCACISAGFVPANLPVLTSVLSCLGKLGTSAAFALIYLYSAEMFPTEVITGDQIKICIYLFLIFEEILFCLSR